MKTIGERIADLRESKDMNQKVLAEHLGITAGQLTRIGKGKVTTLSSDVLISGISVEFPMAYSMILPRFHLYSTYMGFYFNDERSIFIPSNKWRNTYESINYRKIYSLKEKTEKSNTGTIGGEAWSFK